MGIPSKKIIIKQKTPENRWVMVTWIKMLLRNCLTVMDSVICTVGLPLISSIPVTIVMKINEIWFTMAQGKRLLPHCRLGKICFLWSQCWNFIFRSYLFMALSLGAQVKVFLWDALLSFSLALLISFPNILYCAVELLLMFIFRKLSEKKWLSVVRKALLLQCVIVCSDHRSYSAQYTLFRQTTAALLWGLSAHLSPIKSQIPGIP